MCGRYTYMLTWAEIHALFDLTLDSLAPATNFQPRYNAAPTQELPIVRIGLHGRELIFARWGLLPFWARDTKGPPLINARAETVGTTPAFREAYSRSVHEDEGERQRGDCEGACGRECDYAKSEVFGHS